MQDIISKCVFSNKNEQHLQKVLSVLQSSKEGLTKKELSNRTRFLKRKKETNY